MFCVVTRIPDLVSLFFGLLRMCPLIAILQTAYVCFHIESKSPQRHFSTVHVGHILERPRRLEVHPPSQLSHSPKKITLLLEAQEDNLRYISKGSKGEGNSP